MKFLFYLVHPAKFHFHKIQISQLKKKGHEVDILINTKDILEELINETGWQYTNIFPESRKNKKLPVRIGAFFSIFKTMYRLIKFTKGKKYDLFIGDMLTWLGKIKGVPSLFPCDDTLKRIPEQALFYLGATNIISPQILNNYIFNRKTIKYKAYKALAHLHPNHFQPSRSKLPIKLQKKHSYFVIRCTGFMATHDINKKGISNSTLKKLINILKPHGEIIISSELPLSNELKRYSFKSNKNDMAHYISFAKLFISDSTSMTAEAAFLGTPAIEYDDYFHEITQMLELRDKFKLIHCYRTSEEDLFLKKVENLLHEKDLDRKYRKRQERLLSECIDVSSFLVWFYENYPKSKIIAKKTPDYQDRFK